MALLGLGGLERFALQIISSFPSHIGKARWDPVQSGQMKRKGEGNFKRVLCVCSAGILRSATIAWVLSNEPYRCNTRAVGLGDYALIRVTPQLLQWADEIVCADEEQLDALTRMTNKPVHCLHIPDEYDFRSPELVSAIDAALKLLPICGAIHEELSHPQKSGKT
jgi:predicted protein tyrosine phosphatase